MDGQLIQLSDLVVKWISGQYMKKEILIYVSPHLSLDVSQTEMKYFPLLYLQLWLCHSYTRYLILHHNCQGAINNRKGLFCTANSRSNSRFFQKIWIDLTIDLDTYIMHWSWKLYHQTLAQISHTRLNNDKQILQHTQTPPHFLFDRWSESYKLYHGISKLLSSGKIFESWYISNKQIISNLWIQLYALTRTNFTKLCAAMLLRFQWQIEIFLCSILFGSWVEFNITT